MTVEAKSEAAQMAGSGVEPENAAVEAVETTRVVVVEEEEKKESDVLATEGVGEDAAKKEMEVPVVVEEEKIKEGEGVETSASSSSGSSGSLPVQKSSSFREESNFLSDLKEAEKKALFELRSKVEEAILANTIFAKEEEKVDEKDKLKEESKEEEKERQNGKEDGEDEADKKEKIHELIKEEEKSEPDAGIKNSEVVDKEEEISLWGVPLLPSKGSESTDVILLKFLRARDFKANEAFPMLKNTLQWRKETRIDSILAEDTLGSDLQAAAYMDGIDREGHPICYNVYGVFQDSDLYQKNFGSEEKTEQFLRWRIQLMEKGIQKLDFKPGGVSSLFQIIDLKNSPGLSRKELRVAMKKAVGLLQDNYPELVARTIFINVPFWYYAFSAFLSPFLTQRTTRKFVFARPARVTETLLKYIPAEDIPTCYGGLKRGNDSEFSVKDGGVSELFVKSGSSETVEIPAPEVGTTLLWDLTVLGWEVNYKEEFIPTDEGSYTIIVQKGKKMGAQDEPVRNTFRNNEPGKVILTIENNTYRKKRVLYRYKTKNCS